MSRRTDDNQKNDNNGFVWSTRLPLLAGLIAAAALAAARFAPVLAGPLEWLPY